MSAVVPHAFLFRYSLPVRRVPRLPKKGRKLLNLPDDCALPNVRELDESEADFAQLRSAWNPSGIGFSLTVTGRTTPFVCDVDAPTDGDGLQLWIDTRNTQSIHRASRFCHHFCVLPIGGGPKHDQPVAVEVPIARAREERRPAKSEQIPVNVETLRNGYHLEVWLPADVLTGFDPEANPRLGFYYCVQDDQLGEQFLTVGREFPFSHDPSVWSTLELIG